MEVPRPIGLRLAATALVAILAIVFSPPVLQAGATDRNVSWRNPAASTSPAATAAGTSRPGGTAEPPSNKNEAVAGGGAGLGLRRLRRD
ncbi:MAG: hypothetical protein ACE5EF_09310 [Dehalococcoidia bacterium]